MEGGRFGREEEKGRMREVKRLGRCGMGMACELGMRPTHVGWDQCRWVGNETSVLTHLTPRPSGRAVTEEQRDAGGGFEDTSEPGGRGGRR